MEGEPEVATTEAMVVEIEAVAAEVASMIEVAEQQDEETSAQNAALEVLASEQVESQKQIQREVEVEVEQHCHEMY